jgi:hypothetical protein
MLCLSHGEELSHPRIEDAELGSGRITGKPELTPETASNHSGNVPFLM